MEDKSGVMAQGDSEVARVPNGILEAQVTSYVPRQEGGVEAIPTLLSLRGDSVGWSHGDLKSDAKDVKDVNDDAKDVKDAKRDNESHTATVIPLEAITHYSASPLGAAAGENGFPADAERSKLITIIGAGHQLNASFPTSQERETFLTKLDQNMLSRKHPDVKLIDIDLSQETKVTLYRQKNVLQTLPIFIWLESDKLYYYKEGKKEKKDILSYYDTPISH